MTSRTKSEQIVREAVIQANPLREGFCNHAYCAVGIIRLADVFIAIMKKKDGCSHSELKSILLKLAYLWNCFADSLSEQSNETVHFLAELFSKGE